MTGFTVPGAELAAATAFLASLAPSRPADPALGGVLLNVSLEAVRLAVYDTVTAIGGSATIEAKVASSGVALVSVRLLAAIAATVAGEPEVTLAVPDGASTATIRAGRSSWELPVLDLRYYPQLPGLGEPVGEVGTADLVAALGRVTPFAGPTNEPPLHGGICLDAAPGASSLTLATTDAIFRMTVAEVDWRPRAALLDTLVSAEMLTLAAAALRNESAETVALHVRHDAHGGGSAAVVGERFAVLGPLTAARDPGVWRRVEQIMGEPRARVLVDTAELAQTVRRAGAVIDPKDALALTVEDGELTLAAQVGTRSITSHSCIVEAREGAMTPVQVGTNPLFLSQGLASLGSEAVWLEFADRPTKPFRLRPAALDGEVLGQGRHLIAPQYVPGVARAAA